MITRRACFTALAGLAGATTLIGKDNDTMREILEVSLNEKKDVMLYVKGQSIPGTVTKIAGETVELRNREYNRIVVRIESIDAAATA